jgi:hypothetical protein
MNIKNIALWLLASMSIVATCLMTYIAIKQYSSQHKAMPTQIQFESQQWKNVPLYGTNNLRYRMHKDLIARYKLIGMTKEEIIDLLGPQSDPAYFKEWDLRYWMGPEPGPYGIDSIWIVLKIKDNKIVKYRIVSD